MLDIFNFLVSQFYNVIMILDEIVFFDNLSLLKILIIVFIFSFAWKFLLPKGSDK